MNKTVLTIGFFLFFCISLTYAQDEFLLRKVQKRLIAQVDLSPLAAISVKVSPDCQKIAYKDSTRIVVNDKKGKEYKDVSEPFFSPDSKRLAYWAQGDTIWKWFVVLDGNEGKQYDYDIIWLNHLPQLEI